MKRINVLLSLLLFIFSNFTFGQTSATQWCYTELAMDVEIVPATGSMVVKGEAIARIQSPADQISLQINGTWQTLKFATLNSSEGTSEINLTDMAHKALRIAKIHFPVAKQPNDLVHMRFELVKERNSFPLTVTTEAAVAISDANWYPMPPEPGCLLPAGKITFHVPRGWSVASNGTVTSSTDSTGYAVNTYSAPANKRRAFIAAPFKVEHGNSPSGSIVLYLLDAPLNGPSVLSALDKGREFLSEHYGEPPFKEYRIAELPNGIVPWYGASEEGLIISRNEMMRSEEGLLNNLVHEFAHAWWGNKVTPGGPGSYLLNEGMASFSGIEFFRNMYGRGPALDMLDYGSPSSAPDASTFGYVKLLRSDKDVPLSRLKGDSGDDYNIAQSKGVWFLMMLKDRIGEHRFYEVLRSIVSSHSSMTVVEFRDILAKAIPEDAGLSLFLKQWLDQTGMPVLGTDWKNISIKDGVKCSVSLFQSQNGDPYTLDLDLRLLTRKGVVIQTVHLQEAQKTFTLDVPGEVVGIDLDPDRKLLIWRPEYGSPR